MPDHPSAVRRRAERHGGQDTDHPRRKGGANHVRRPVRDVHNEYRDRHDHPALNPALSILSLAANNIVVRGIVFEQANTAISTKRLVLRLHDRAEPDPGQQRRHRFQDERPIPVERERELLPGQQHRHLWWRRCTNSDRRRAEQRHLGGRHRRHHHGHQLHRRDRGDVRRHRATGVTVVNDTTITATTPAHVPGAVNVAVTTPSGTGIGPGVYTYTVGSSATTLVSSPIRAPSGRP